MNSISIFFLTAVFLGGCAAKASDFGDLVEAGDIDESKPHGKDYANAFIAQGESQPPKGINLTGCPEHSKAFTMVLIVDEKGHIAESHSSPETAESRCIAKEFSAHEYPVPPFAPFHIVMVWDQ